MNKVCKLAIAASVLAASACSFPQVGNVQYALGTAVSPNNAFVNNGVRPLKRGTAEQNSILFYNAGDASLQTAMKNGGITRVHHIDYEVQNVLFLVTKTTTIVYGE